MSPQHTTYLAAGLLVLFVSASRAYAGDGDPSAKKPASLTAALEQRVSCDFAEAPVREAVDFFRTLLDVNIVYDPGESDAEERLITLQIADMPARSALAWLTRKAGLEYALVDGAVYIAPREHVLRAGKVYFRQYQVSDLDTRYDLLAAANSASDDRDDNNDDNGNGRSGRRSGAHDLLRMVVLFTGGLQNWDHVEVIGYGFVDEDNDESGSEEDSF